MALVSLAGSGTEPRGEQQPSCELQTALAVHGEELAQELQLLLGMVQVRLSAGSVFDRAKPKGSVAQKRGVICKLLCCGKQLDQKCNDLSGEKACPTHVEAARLLRRKIEAQHGSPECLAKARGAVGAAQGDSNASDPPVDNAFALMMANELAKQRARKTLRQKEQLLQQSEQQLLHAKQMSEHARSEYEEVKAEVDRLEGKEQKTNPNSARDRPPHFEKYGEYTTKQWLQTTGEIMNRRAVVPVAGVRKSSVAEGAEGALEHWRRGLVGACCDWAAGSLENVVDLMVRLIKHFKVSKWQQL